MQIMSQSIRGNPLSFALFALFAIYKYAQRIPGWRIQNQDTVLHRQAAVGYWHDLFSGALWERPASNGQVAVLQLGSVIEFSGLLYRRGTPHSLDPRKPRNESGR